MNRLTVNGFARLGRLLIGLVAGMIVAGTLSQAMTERVSASPGSPVWILNAISPGQACSNWRDDHSIFHGTTPFSYYWSGQPQWWNYPPADACWHNDEVSSSWWRAIDVGYPKNNPVYYRSLIYASNMAPVQLYGTSSCGGVDIQIWTPNGNYAGRYHVWHLVRNTSIIGTTSAQHLYVPGESHHWQQIGTVLDHDQDSCENTADHVHQAVFQSGWAQPNMDGAVTWGPIHFSW